QEGVGRGRGGGQVLTPFARLRGEDDVIPVLPDEDLVRGELVVLWQPHGLAAVGHENLGGSGHGSGPPGPLCHILHVYGTACLDLALRAVLADREEGWIRQVFARNTLKQSESHPPAMLRQ